MAESFVEIYHESCIKRNETPDNMETYQELDILYNFIMKHENSQELKAALNPYRICIVIPYVLFNDKRLPPDDNIDGEDVIFASPGYDTYRSLIVDQMQPPTLGLLAWLRTPENVNLWKLKRLEKVFSLGWKEFRQQYLAPSL